MRVAFNYQLFNYALKIWHRCARRACSFSWDVQVLYFVLMGGETFSEAQVIGYAVDDSELSRCACLFWGVAKQDHWAIALEGMLCILVIVNL